VTTAVTEGQDTHGAPIACIEERANELFEMLRAAFVRAGARESRSEGQDGFNFGDGDGGKVCLEYCESQREGSSPRAALCEGETSRYCIALLNLHVRAVRSRCSRRPARSP
jgi:hypothetical protein